MANRCYLTGWDPARGAAVKPSLEASYIVPPFWLAMFGPEDLHDLTLDGPSFTNPPNAPADFKIQTYLYCAASKARERLAARLPELGAELGREELAQKFVKFAGGFRHDVLLQLSEIAPMVAAGQFATALRSQLAQLDYRASLPIDWQTESHAENLLVGWGTELTAQERERAKQRRQHAKANREEQRRRDAWLAALDRVPPAQRRPYSASETYRVDDVIEHGKLGPGVVLRVIERTKLEVLFGDGTHMLAHRPS